MISLWGYSRRPQVPATITLRMRALHGGFSGSYSAGAVFDAWTARVNLNLPKGDYEVAFPLIPGAGAVWLMGTYTSSPSSGPPNPLKPAPGPAKPTVTSALGPFCVRNSGAVADTSPCTGMVKPGGFVFTAVLKRQIPAPLDTVKFYTVPLGSTSAVLGALSGSGTSVGSTYAITAPPQLCMNTGTTYSVRVFAGGTSYGDIGQFWPDCR